MISIVAVNFQAYEFADLLLESIERTKSENLEIILPDNSFQPNYQVKTRHPIQTFSNPTADKTHGAGLNLGVNKCTGDYTLILDVDCHFLRPGWEGYFLNAIRDAHCVTVQGTPEKPIRPACCFLRTEDAKRYDWRATPGYKGHRVTPEGFDVGIIAYRQMVANGLEVRFMETTRANRYATKTGEEYGLSGEWLLYHHWHGTHLPARQIDYPHDLIEDKDRLFNNLPWKKKAKFL